MNWTDITHKTGKGKARVTCPECSKTRTKKKDTCLAVDYVKGYAKCFNCDEWCYRPEEIKTYNLPPQEWRNYTTLSDNLVKWFRDVRKISQSTLIACKITEEKYYQPSLKKEVNNIVFNYFSDGKLVNKKYRSADKKFTQTTNTKKVFYGIDDVKDSKEAYIVEGEMDKLAMWEQGITNCISVPNGAKDFNDLLETSRIEHINKFIIAVDQDEAGRELEQELIKRLGKHRCSRITFVGKDANDDLISGCLEQSVTKANDYPLDGSMSPIDMVDEYMSLYHNGFDNPMQPKGEVWSDFNKIFSPLRGQMTVVTGIPSHGKSNWVEDYVLNLINDNDLKASFYSPEHYPLQLHLGNLAEKVIGKPFLQNHSVVNRMTPQEAESGLEWLNKRIQLCVPENGDLPDWDWIIELFKQQVYRYGSDIFIIDAFNKIKRQKSDSHSEISEILARLTMFCQTHDVHLFLIAHPTKMRKKEGSDSFEEPTLYDVKGSGDFYDQTHNGLCVYRDFEGGFTHVNTLKVKMKHQGISGAKATFRYTLANGRYKSMHSGMCTKDDYEPIYKLGKEDSLERDPELIPSEEFDNPLPSQGDSPF